MATSSQNPSKLTIFSIITIFSISPISNAISDCLLSPDLELRLRSDSSAIRAASNDYGNLIKRNPHAVLYPSSVDDVVQLIKLSNDCPTPFSIAARGRGHSVRGQAAAHGGVVVDMASLGRNGSRIRVSWDASLGYYADVGGEQLWIDVLRAGLEHGLVPVSWTDYLYLSVGGTLSNGGISGQSSSSGPQIMNVLELDVVTGKGDLVTCSKEMNSELFFAVLGGLGQFGIITRARIVLHKAPSRAKWVRLIYTDFSKFTRDQEHLISSNKINGPDYVEGSVITDKSPPNNWRSSSFYSSSHLIDLGFARIAKNNSNARTQGFTWFDQCDLRPRERIWKGDLVTCSKEMNSELFFAVLGGLGQFGIITRARIVLHKAPSRAKWVRLIYTDFSKFTRDQEHLISSNKINGPDYVEGSVITDKSPPNNWRSSSFYSSSHQTKIHSLLKTNGGILYSLELVKYYTRADTIHQEIELMVKDLSFVGGFEFKKDVALVDFLNRVGSLEEEEREEEEKKSHPWLNLFIPKSRIMDFNAAVFLNIIRNQNQTSGPILFYPLQKQKWDERMSAVVPEDEDIFYTLGLLHSTKCSESYIFDNLNREILEFCERSGIKIKQYLPFYESKEDWIKHFGYKWNTFQERKTKFDPRMLLSPGQRIFTAVMESDV